MQRNIVDRHRIRRVSSELRTLLDRRTLSTLRTGYEDMDNAGGKNGIAAAVISRNNPPCRAQ